MRNSKIIMMVLIALSAALSMRAYAGDDVAKPGPAALIGEGDVNSVAAEIAKLTVVDKPEIVDALLDVIARPSELLRARATLALLKMTRGECLDRLRAHGFAHANAVVRAYAACICGRLKYAPATVSLRAIIEKDDLWLARSEAAIACGELRDIAAKPSIVKMLNSDPSEKARLGAIDALGLLGPDAADAVPVITAYLWKGTWQQRVSACQSLAQIGSVEAVPQLIDRMFVESDRIAGEIYCSLTTITGEDLGITPQAWWHWWWDGKNTGRQQPPSARTGAHRFGFVLDASTSMQGAFALDSYSDSTKLAICKDIIQRVLANLNMGSKFSIVALAPTRPLIGGLVEASPENVALAGEQLRVLSGTGEGSLFEGLRKVLLLEAGPDESAGFRDTPDRIKIMTDRVSTVSDMTPEDIVEWYSALNRYARVSTDVDVFGTDGSGLLALKTLA